MEQINTLRCKIIERIESIEKIYGEIIKIEGNYYSKIETALVNVKNELEAIIESYKKTLDDLMKYENPHCVNLNERTLTYQQNPICICIQELTMNDDKILNSKDSVLKIVNEFSSEALNLDNNIFAILKEEANEVVLVSQFYKLFIEKLENTKKLFDNIDKDIMKSFRM